MSSQAFTCAARDANGQMSVWRVSAENNNQAVSYIELEILRKAPFQRPRIILVGIDGGKQL